MPSHIPLADERGSETSNLRRDRKGAVPFTPLLLLCVLASFAQEPAAPPATPYAGTEACAACHEDLSNAFAKNRHAFLDTSPKRGWEKRACEACHGPATKHTETASAEEIRQPAKLPVARADQICLTCHQNQPTHVGRIHGSHARNQVSCVGCHPIHSTPETPKNTSRQATISQQCSTCHISERTQFQRPHAHPINVGAMSCADCHNPHGTFLRASQRTVSANEPGCLKCHGDKRGPFAFEHAPVRFEGCASCHESHGSANPRMLKRHEVANLCLECHANIGTQTGIPLGGVPPAFHDLRSARYRNCTTCHMKIHGSHVNKAFLR